MTHLLSAPVRVVLADDHAIVREGLRALLERGGEIAVVGEAATGREAVELTLRLLPNVVVMDFTMPEMNGVAACQAMQAQVPQTRVLFLSMHEEEAYFARALEAGAVGFLVKSSASTDLRAAILRAARGEVFLAPTLAGVLLRLADDPPPTVALTQREREVLHLVAEGNINQAIATRLGISIKTVQTHREHIMEKLELRDITQLVRYAIRHGIISANP